MPKVGTMNYFAEFVKHGSIYRKMLYMCVYYAVSEAFFIYLQFVTLWM